MTQAVEPLWRARGDALRERFGEKVQKLAVDAGFTCPNLDGSKGKGGCTYCNNASFSPVAGLRKRLTIHEQLARGAAFYAASFDSAPRAAPGSAQDDRSGRRRRRGAPARRYLAYSLPFTNTYAPLERLRAAYDEALQFDGVVGLAIGTRPDCIPDDVLDLLESHARRGIHVALELGLQTANDETQRRTNRCHTLADFVDAARRSAGRGLEVGAHVILGLPGEGRDDARRTAEAIAALPIEVVKLHHCYVCEGTALADDLRAGRFRPPEMDEYVVMAADFLERLPAHVAIERICAQCKPSLLIAPQFPGGVTEVARRLAGELERRGTRQGALL